MPHQVRIAAGITLGLVLLSAPLPASADGGVSVDGGVSTGGSHDLAGKISVGSGGSGGGSEGGGSGSGSNGESVLINGKSGAQVHQDFTTLTKANADMCTVLGGSTTTARKSADPAVAAAADAYYAQNCQAGATPGSFAPPAWLLGQEAVAQMDLPSAIPSVGPDPANNEWKMAGVGYPLWLSAPGPTTQAASASVQGYTVTLNAVRQGITFSMGDGGSVQCTTTTPYSAGGAPGKPSPDCGYTYTKPSKPGKYRIVATSTWAVTWSVLGQTGVIPVTKLGGTSITVGELEAIVHA